MSESLGSHIIGKEGSREDFFGLTVLQTFRHLVPMNLKRFSPAASLCTLLVASFLGSSHLQAGSSNKSGNPYGNGTFFPDSGTFSAIVRGTNGFLGVMQFSTTSAAPTNSLTNSGSTAGVATVYAYGEQFSGTANGVVSGSSIATTYLANYSYNLLIPSNNITLQTNGVTTTNQSFSTEAVNDTVNGQFDATLYNSYPTQSFSGTGQATAIFTVVNQTNFTISAIAFRQTNSVTGTRLVQ